MAKPLFLKSSEITPNIIFDPVENHFEIEGRSIPADADELYSVVHKWLNEYLRSTDEGIVLNMNLEYFNTASHKYIAEIFRMMKEISPNSIVNWYFHIDDDEMKQVGEIFDRIFDIKFNLISYQDD